MVTIAEFISEEMKAKLLAATERRYDVIEISLVKAGNLAVFPCEYFLEINARKEGRIGTTFSSYLDEKGKPSERFVMAAQTAYDNSARVYHRPLYGTSQQLRWLQDAGVLLTQEDRKILAREKTTPLKGYGSGWSRKALEERGIR